VGYKSSDKTARIIHVKSKVLGPIRSETTTGWLPFLRTMIDRNLN
ncbi:unnamed protein product, partial [Acidithrix sp. C25]